MSLCEEDNKGLSNYLYMLLTGQFFHGLAGTVLYTIGPSFIDGSVSAKQSPTYLGNSKSTTLKDKSRMSHISDILFNLRLCTDVGIMYIMVNIAYCS